MRDCVNLPDNNVAKSKHGYVLMCKTTGCQIPQKIVCDKCHYRFCNLCSNFSNHDCDKYKLDDLFGENDSDNDLLSLEELNSKSHNITTLAKSDVTRSVMDDIAMETNYESDSTQSQSSNNINTIATTQYQPLNPSPTTSTNINQAVSVKEAITTTPSHPSSATSTVTSINQAVSVKEAITTTHPSGSSTTTNNINAIATTKYLKPSSATSSKAKNISPPPSMDMTVAKRIVGDLNTEKTITPTRIPMATIPKKTKKIVEVTNEATTSVPTPTTTIIIKNNAIESIGMKRIQKELGNHVVAGADSADSDDDAGPRRIKRKVLLLAKFNKPNPKLPKFKGETNPQFIKILTLNCSSWNLLTDICKDSIQMSRRVNNMNSEIYFRFDLKGSGTRLDNNIIFKEHQSHADLEVFHVLDSDYAGSMLEMICMYYQSIKFEFWQFVPHYYGKNKKNDEESKTVSYFESLAQRIPKRGYITCEKKGSNFVFKLI
jgi:hypothetical protein